MGNNVEGLMPPGSPGIPGLGSLRGTPQANWQGPRKTILSACDEGVKGAGYSRDAGSSMKAGTAPIRPGSGAWRIHSALLSGWWSRAAESRGWKDSPYAKRCEIGLKAKNQEVLVPKRLLRTSPSMRFRPHGMRGCGCSRKYGPSPAGTLLPCRGYLLDIEDPPDDRAREPRATSWLRLSYRASGTSPLWPSWQLLSWGKDLQLWSESCPCTG